jgi:phosphoribulokinase
MLMTLKERLRKIDAYIVVGIGGDSGAGKTTFSRGIRRLLGDDLVSGFSMDDYHAEDRATRKRTGHLPLDPRYNKLDLLAQHLSELRRGHEIIKPVYNHTTGEFDPQVLYRPSRVMMVEGLHPFYTKDLRDRMDLTIFVDPVRDVKWKWKMKRDVEKRGHDREDAFQEILAREPLFKQFIDVQKIWSEVVIRIEPSRYSDPEIENPQVKLLMRATDIPTARIDMNLRLSDFITGSSAYFSLEFGSDYYYGRRFNILTVDGLMKVESVESLQERICEFTGSACENLFDTKDGNVNPSGFAQLMIAWRFLERLNLILTDLENA